MSGQPVKSDTEIETSKPDVQNETVEAATPVDIPGTAATETPTEKPTQDKGKGILVEPVTQDISMDDADSSSEDEAAEGGAEVVDVEEDTMEEIDPQNIITGDRRTRGRTIDFAKAAEEMGPDEEEEDEEDDDFEIVEDEEMKD